MAIDGPVNITTEFISDRWACDHKPDVNPHPDDPADVQRAHRSPKLHRTHCQSNVQPNSRSDDPESNLDPHTDCRSDHQRPDGGTREFKPDAESSAKRQS